MKYLFTITLINVTCIRLMSELFFAKRWAKLWGLLRINFRFVFANPLNVVIYNVFRQRNRKKSTNKRRIHSLVSRLSASFDFSFSVEERQGLHTSLQQTNELILNTQKTSILNLLTMTFLAIQNWQSRGKSSYINRRWKWTILFLRSLTVSQKKRRNVHLTRVLLLFIQKRGLFFALVKW